MFIFQKETLNKLQKQKQKKFKPSRVRPGTIHGLCKVYKLVEDANYRLSIGPVLSSIRTLMYGLSYVFCPSSQRIYDQQIYCQRLIHVYVA